MESVLDSQLPAALSAVLMVLTSVMIRLYRKITGTSQLEGML